MKNILGAARFGMVDVVAIKLIVAVNQWATMDLVVASIVAPRPSYMRLENG